MVREVVEQVIEVELAADEEAANGGIDLPSNGAPNPDALNIVEIPFLKRKRRSIQSITCSDVEVFRARTPAFYLAAMLTVYLFIWQK